VVNAPATPTWRLPRWSIYIDPPHKIHADLSAGVPRGFIVTSDGHRRVRAYGARASRHLCG